MVKAILVPNIVEANGKTVRENNLEVQHTIPLKTFVEINLGYSESHGCRGFVVDHERDCDGTPLYGISLSPDDADHICAMQKGVNENLPEAEAWLQLARSRVNGGWSDGCLIVLRKPDEVRETIVDRLEKALNQFPVLDGRVSRTQCEKVVEYLSLFAKERNPR